MVTRNEKGIRKDVNNGIVRNRNETKASSYLTLKNPRWFLAECIWYYSSFISTQTGLFNVSYSAAL